MSTPTNDATSSSRAATYENNIDAAIGTETAFVASLSPEQRELMAAYETRMNDLASEQVGRMVDGICAHFPGLTPAIEAIASVSHGDLAGGSCACWIDFSALATVAPAVVLCPVALKAAVRNDEERQRIRAAERDFKADLSDSQLKQWNTIRDADSAADQNEFTSIVNDVVRHVPPLGAAMSLVMAHVIETYSGEREACCTGAWIRDEVEV